MWCGGEEVCLFVSLFVCLSRLDWMFHRPNDSGEPGESAPTSTPTDGAQTMTLHHEMIAALIGEALIVVELWILIVRGRRL